MRLGFPKYFKRLISISLVVLIAFIGVPMNAFQTYAYDENILKENHLFENETKYDEIQDEKYIDNCLEFDDCSHNLTEKFEANVIDSGMCGDNLTWTFYSNGTLQISGTGSMQDFPFYQSGKKTAETPWEEYCDEIISLNISNGVTSIGMQAFRGLNHITNQLVLPSSLISIGNYAFEDCSHISGTLVIPDNVEYMGRECFKNCSSIIGELIIPPKIDTLEPELFKDCTGLNTVIFHKNIIKIGDSCFAGCSEIKDLIFEGMDSVEIADTAFYNIDCRCYFPIGHKENYYELTQQQSFTPTWIAFKDKDDLTEWRQNIELFDNESCQFAKGITDSNNGTLIVSVEQLSKIQEGKYTLGKDIIIDSSSDWQGIDITGEMDFDGQGYKIINNSEISLFSSITDCCKIENLSYIQMNKNAKGMIDTFSVYDKENDEKEYSLIIDNCCVSGFSSKAGFVGSAESYCSGIFSNIFGSNHYYAKASLVINDCKSCIELLSSTQDDIGGFLGSIRSHAATDGARYVYHNGDGHLNVDISNSKSDVIIAGGNYSGGMIGYIRQEGWGEGDIRISNCTVNGLIQGASAGGFIGGEVYDYGTNAFAPCLINCDSLCRVSQWDEFEGANYIGIIDTFGSTSDIMARFSGVNYYDNEYKPVGKGRFEGEDTIYHISQKGKIDKSLQLGLLYNLGDEISYDDGYEVLDFDLHLDTYCKKDCGANYSDVLLYVKLPPTLSFANSELKKQVWNLGSLSEAGTSNCVTKIPLIINTEEYVEFFKIEVSVTAEGYDGIFDDFLIPVTLINNTPNIEGFNYDIYMANMLVEEQRTPYIKYEDIYKNHNLCQQILDGANTSDEILMQMWKSDFLIGWIKDPKGALSYEVNMSDYYFALLMKMIKDSGKKQAFDAIISVEHEMNDLYEEFFSQTDNMRKAMKLSDVKSDIPLLKKMLSSKVIKYKNKTLSVPAGDNSIYDWVSDYMEVVFKSATTVADAIEETQNICMLYELESSYKEVIQDMYNIECKTRDDICMQIALKRLINCMNNSKDEFLFYTGRMTGEFLFDILWKGTMDAIKESYPIAALVFLSVDTGHAYANVVANTDDIIDAEYNAVMMANITSLIWTTYLHNKTEYIIDRNDEKAKKCIAASKLYENACSLNIEMADKYVDAVNKSLASRIKFVIRSWFTKTNDLKETIAYIKQERTIVDNLVNDARLYCTEQLKIDYPSSGLYEYIKNGGKTNAKAGKIVKKYEMACPVKVIVSSQYGKSYISDDSFHSDGYTIMGRIGSKKFVYAFEDEDLSINILGLNSGKMTCKITKYSNDELENAVLAYYDVPVSPDLEYRIKAYSNEKTIEESEDPVNVLIDSSNKEVESSNHNSVSIKVDGGYIEENNNSYNNGDEIHIMAEVPYGRRFVKWESESSLSGIIDDLNCPYTLLRVPENDISLHAITEKAFDIYTVSAICGTGGFMNLIGDINVEKGESLQLCIMEEEGYEIQDVLIDSKSIGKTNIYRFDDIATDHTIEAIFKRKITVKGDVTGDKDVAMNDVIKVARAVAGSIILSEEEMEAADVTGDGDVAMGDVIKLARFVAGSIYEL